MEIVCSSDTNSREDRLDFRSNNACKMHAGKSKTITVLKIVSFIRIINFEYKGASQCKYYVRIPAEHKRRVNANTL